MGRFPGNGSDGIMQFSIDGVVSCLGTGVKAVVAGSLVATAFAKEIAKTFEVYIAPHTVPAEGQTR